MIEVPPLNSTDMERADANQPAGVLGWNEVVNDMVRLRQAIDPEWVLEEWLEARAAEELRLIEMDLNRELLRLIHRKKRIESIAEDLDHTLEQPKIESNISPEEFEKHKKEEAILEQIAAAGQDPQVLKQMEAMKAGAAKTETTEFVGHKHHDGTASGAVTTEQVVGNVTIEEEIGNENK